MLFNKHPVTVTIPIDLGRLSEAAEVVAPVWGVNEETGITVRQIGNEYLDPSLGHILKRCKIVSVYLDNDGELYCDYYEDFDDSCHTVPVSIPTFGPLYLELLVRDYSSSNADNFAYKKYYVIHARTETSLFDERDRPISVYNRVDAPKLALAYMRT